MIVNNVVDGGPALKVPAHLSLGLHVIDSLMVHSEKDSVALVNGDTGAQTTFSQILQRTVDVAIGFQNLGVKRGDTVAICAENRIEYLYATLGAICCGATVAHINHLYSKDELLHALNISSPRFAVVSQAAIKTHWLSLRSYSTEKIVQLDGRSAVNDEVEVLSNLMGEGSDVRVYEPALVQGHTDTAFIFFTSGTAGPAKAVRLTHINYLYSLELFKIQNQGNRRVISALPWCYAYGLMSAINNIFVNSFLVYFTGRFNPQKYLQNIQTFKIQELVTVPPTVLYLAKAPLVGQFNLSTVELAWCSGSPLSSDNIEAAMKRLKNCKGIYQTYGMTELSVIATCDKPQENHSYKPGSSGYPIPGVKFKVVQVVTRAKLGPNQQGEVCVKGPIIMRGYVGDDSTAQEIIDEEGYLLTGDVGYYDANGYLFIVDRLSEFIKLKGSQVAPATVENEILKHSNVAECGVIGIPDERLEELPLAFIVPKTGAQLTEKDFLQFSSDKLPPHCRLHSVQIVTDVPKNHNGIILRRALKEKI